MITKLKTARSEMVWKLQELIERVEAGTIQTFAFVIEMTDEDGDQATAHGWQLTDKSNSTALLGGVEIMRGCLVRDILEGA